MKRARQESKNALEERDRAKKDLLVSANMAQEAENAKNAAIEREKRALEAEKRAAERIKALEEKEREMRQAYEDEKNKGNDVGWLGQWFQ